MKEKKLRDSILEAKLEFGKDADGCDIVTCPLCGRWQWALITRWDNNNIGLENFDHKKNCAYLIAKKKNDMESELRKIVGEMLPGILAEAVEKGNYATRSDLFDMTDRVIREISS